MTTLPADRPNVSPLLRFALACAIFAVVVLIVFGDVLITSGRVVSMRGTDIWGQFYAWRQFGFGELDRGHLPLWNPYIFCGAPYLGGFQSALLYPPNWLYLLIDMPAAINVGAALHIFLAGVFMYCWTTFRGLHWLACVSSGMVFMLGGPQMGQLLAGHLPNACAIIWAPLVFLAIDDLALTRSPRAIFLGAAAVALQVLAGHPQYVFYTAIGAGIYVILNLFIIPHRWRLIGGFFFFYLCGGLLSAMQLLTGLQATSEAMRAKLSVDIVSMFSFPPENLLTMVLPKFLGGYGDVPYWGRWFYWEMSAFIGVTALVLAIFGLATPRPPRRFTFTMLCLMFLLAVGKYTPIGDVVFRLPGFDSFRGISKFMFLVLMFLALLSGFGFDWLLRGGQIKKGFVEYLAGAALLFIIAAVTILISAKSEFSGGWGQMLHSNNWTFKPLPLTVEFLHQAASAAAWDLWWAAGACVMVGAILVVRRRYPRAGAALVLVLAVELIVFARGVHSSFAVADLQSEVDLIAAHFGDANSDTRTWTYDQGAFFMARRPNSWGDDPMMLRRYVELMAGALQMTPDQLLVTMPSNYGALNAPAWKLTRTGWLFLQTGAGMNQFSNPHRIMPRAALIGSLRVESDRAKVLSDVSDASFEPTETAVVESSVALTTTGQFDLGHVEVHEDDTDTLTIDATANSPCLLLITDAYAAGWHAEAMTDSVQRAYDVIPADLAFRGIPLTTAGHHHIRLFYRPTAFVVGEWVTIASLIAYVGALMFWLGRRHLITEVPDPPTASPATAST